MDQRELIKAIKHIEQQRDILGDPAADAAIKAIEDKLKEGSQVQQTIPDKRGERKLITVMFADLAGFTELSGSLDPEELREIINAVFERLAKIIIKYDGFIEKYIGDEIMALFGAPLSVEDHAHRSLYAALAMMAEIEQFNKEWDTDLGLHIGINTGKVVTGMIGSETKRDYDVLGDAVNLAARLKQISTRGQIFISENTYGLTGRFFKFKILIK